MNLQLARPLPDQNIATGRCVARTAHACLLLAVVVQVLDLLADCSSAGASKGCKLGFATLLLNYAVLLASSDAPSQDEDAQLQVLSGALELAGNAQQEGDQEALYRALLAMGTLVRPPIHGIAGEYLQVFVRPNCCNHSCCAKKEP